MLKLKKYDKVELHWRDSHARPIPTWQDESDIDIQEDYIIKTIGYFIEQDKTWLILCQGYVDNQIQGEFRIPRQCIAEITKI